jgi:hypothetical protein
LEARKMALKEMQQTSMKAHGKIQGKDVFSWINADVDSLANTLKSLPYPIIWLTQTSDLFLMKEHHPDSLEQIHSIVHFSDQTSLAPSTERIQFYQMNNFKEGLYFLNSIEIQKSIVLITLDGQENIESLKEYLMDSNLK